MDDEPPNHPEFISLINEYYQNLLGYQLEQTSLQQIPESKWEKFSTQRGLNPNSSGIYLPRNQTAVIQDGNQLSLFHEYFGHGLYCEQSLLGRKLIDLEKKLLEEEKIKFSNKQFTLDDLDNFRLQNDIFNELDNFRKQNLIQYELFATWTEYLLCKEFNFKNKFEKKYDLFCKEDKEVVDSVVNFSESYGNLAMFYKLGLARRTTPERVKKLLEDIYGEKLQEVKFILLYGSKKPFSDIDVFMIGENPQESHSDWLDVKMQSPRNLKKGIENFDVRTLIPLMNGEFIFGDEKYFEQAKEQVLSQEITNESIKHNLKWSARMQRLRNENLNDDFLKNKFEKYSQTYLANALALKKGKKLFNKEDLILYSQSEVDIIERRNRKNAT